MLDLTNLKELIRNFLLADTGVSASVAGRIYFSELFTLNNPSYPIVNIDLFEGRNLLPAVDRVGLNVSISSKTSYDESDGIYTLVDNLLNNSIIGLCNATITELHKYNINEKFKLIGITLTRKKEKSLRNKFNTSKKIIDDLEYIGISTSRLINEQRLVQSSLDN